MTQLKTIGILCAFVLTIAMVSSPLAYHAFAQPSAHKTTNENVKLQINAEKKSSEPVFVSHKKSKELSGIKDAKDNTKLQHKKKHKKSKNY
ncbi:hypothetical protein [Candidatus Nitrosotenuis cloacae]|uniref:Uncharacterized protein n=1 Tax=Candidatus Nitrosotenuis cloacae TaxID=1603555 RepID=A0A3G1B173_9ARCH|nr:hypothetical protein [Candidatus Nitrosotenuis cloacae]AJZ75884.1 hypothetical protein SU86_005335 [Candidatus Nitrosotenuis cloacae]